MLESNLKLINLTDLAMNIKMSEFNNRCFYTWDTKLRQ